MAAVTSGGSTTGPGGPRAVTPGHKLRSQGARKIEQVSTTVNNVAAEKIQVPHNARVKRLRRTGTEFVDSSETKK